MTAVTAEEASVSERSIERNGVHHTVVYTDGACSGNPGPGGWGWVIPGGRYRSGAASHTTNQRMELAAALDAVGAIDGALEIVSDSTYVVNCFRDGWWKGWLSRGWKNTAKKPVANRDLWEPLVEAYRTRPITFRWVKGHGGNEWNDAADRLAVEASVTQQGVEGEGTLPTERAAPVRRPGGSRGVAPDRADQATPSGLPVYTHGTCEGYSGHGGWAWLVPGRSYRSGVEERTTNPRIELIAVLEAVRAIDGALEIVSDSTYVVSCFRDGWWRGWLSRGWVNSKNKPVANRDLWEPLIDLVRARPLTFRPAEPADDEWPARVEWLASEASRTRQGVEGRAVR